MIMVPSMDEPVRKWWRDGCVTKDLARAGLRGQIVQHYQRNVQEPGLYPAGSESDQKVMSLMGWTIYEFP